MDKVKKNQCKAWWYCKSIFSSKAKCNSI